MSYHSMREADVYGAAYQAAGIDPGTPPEIIYEGDGYWITRDEDGRVWFEDNTARAELARVPNAPDYIKYDEFRGWIFKNGRELPWKND